MTTARRGMRDDDTRAESVTKDSWRDNSGQKGARQQERTDVQLGPLGLSAIDALALHPAEQVLDVGCGAGQTLLQLAERVGSNGWVTGIDIAEPLVNLARARIAASSHAHVDVVLADAESVVLLVPTRSCAPPRPSRGRGDARLAS